MRGLMLSLNLLPHGSGLWPTTSFSSDTTLKVNGFDKTPAFVHNQRTPNTSFLFSSSSPQSHRHASKVRFIHTTHSLAPSDWQPSHHKNEVIMTNYPSRTTRTKKKEKREKKKEKPINLQPITAISGLRIGKPRLPNQAKRPLQRPVKPATSDPPVAAVIHLRHRWPNCVKGRVCQEINHYAIACFALPISVVLRYRRTRVLP